MLTGAHYQLDDSDSADSSDDRPWSPSVLALLSTSRQLRFCAIRHIFRDIHIYCGEVDEPMNKLRQLIMPDSAADLPLGSIAPNIKSLYIHIAEGFSNNPPCYDSTDELFHSSLLDSIRHQSPLHTLFLGGFVTSNLACSWDELPTDIQRTVTSLLRLPSLKSFEIYSISSMNGEIFRDIAIQKLSVAGSLEYGLFNNSVVNIPAIQNHDILSLQIQRSGVTAMLSLHNLQHLSASCLPLQCLDALWRTITSSWRNLTRLEIDDKYFGRTVQSYTIPESINITLLPRLEVFTYRHTHPHPGLPQSTVLPQVTFFRVKDNVCAALKRVDTKETPAGTL
ncbi:hypothetical protein D9619_006663 [Psilocybe cf. subviscida]|uniref:Uncharacterized protein n=1 Tax=Psilocybe cf. subviscida TaxID=2480587 RepID=A0A8H5EXF7_9AGAR|nr:hypothetical protein D9619_006663 [Psilocybe cf. subviscida]